MTEKKQGKPYKLEDRDGRMVRVYESGTVLDHATGSILRPPPHALITVESTTRMHRARQEQKRAAIAAGAQAIVDQGPSLSGADKVDWVQAVAEAAATKALNPDDPKAIDAARFLLQESGLAEPKQAQAEAAPVRHIHEMDPATLRLLQDVRQAQLRDVVDADATDVP